MTKSAVKECTPLLTTPTTDNAEGMSKFGVSEAHKNKLASKRTTHCPLCAEQLVAHGQVLLCPTHGSEPFEY